MPFVKATKTQRKAKIGLIGPTGAGKTLTALSFAAQLLEPGSRIALIDTENASASLYGDLFDFDTQILESFSPRTYIKAIHEAEASGDYGVLVIDSLSHAWAGKDGVLEMVDEAARRSKSGNSYVAWRDATPEHNDLVDALVRCRLDLIVTMRSKMAYVQEKDEKTGKTEVRKVGLQPIQRDGLEYEFDLVADIDTDHRFIVSKTRCGLMDGKVILKPAGDAIEPFRAWLRDGAVAPEPAPQAETASRERLSQGRPDGTEPTSGAAPRGSGGAKAKTKIDAGRPCVDSQRALIYQLAQQTQLGKDDAALVLRNLYHVGSSRELTYAQADDLIGRLQQVARHEMAADDLVGLAIDGGSKLGGAPGDEDAPPADQDDAAVPA